MVKERDATLGGYDGNGVQPHRNRVRDSVNSAIES